MGKSLKLQKCVLFDVLESITADSTTAALSNSYKFSPEEFKFFKHQPSRLQWSKNWIILIAPSPLKAIIKNGAYSNFGRKLCRIRPFTSVVRCHKCQLFGRPKKHWPNEIYCDNCGDEHCSTCCSCIYCCINC